MKPVLILEHIAGIILLLAMILAIVQKSFLLLFLLLLSMGTLIAALVLTYKKNTTLNFLIAQLKRDSQSKSRSENTILYKKVELAIFENQINPHFLYNTLDSIRGEALINGQPEIASMTEKLSNFFRYCISSKGTIVKISEELRNVTDYFAIQKYRFGDRIDLDLQIDDSMMDYYIPKLTLQPLVENAIAHGIENSHNKGTVTISMFPTARKLYLYVKDNGKGMSNEDLMRMNERLKNNQVQVSSSGSRHTGIAIQNVNSRLRICFGEEYGLHYRSLPGEGTVVEIILPTVDDFTRGSFEKKMQEIL